MMPATTVDSELSRLELVQLGPTFVVDSVALRARDGRSTALTIQDCGKGLLRITKIEDGIKYWRGDLLNLAGTLFGEESSQLLDPELLDEKESADEMRVAEKVSPVTRAHSPSWDHSFAVVKLAEPEQVEWLDRARGEGWSARTLVTEMAKAKAGGKTVLKFWLIVGPIETEAKREALAKKVESEGFSVKRQEKLKKVPKPKKGPVTARAKRSTPKAATRRRA